MNIRSVVASVALLGGFLCLPSWAHAQSCSNPTGKWVNELNSTLTVSHKDPQSGLLRGTYISPSGTEGQTFPLIGWFNTAPPVSGQDNTTLITFSVNWGSQGSITAWSGLCTEVNGVPTISALWHLTSANATFSWSHVLSGLDTFKPLTN